MCAAAAAGSVPLLRQLAESGVGSLLIQLVRLQEQALLMCGDRGGQEVSYKAVGTGQQG